MNSVEVFPTVLNCSKQSGVIGNKRWSCEGRYEVFKGRLVVVNTVGGSRAWSGNVWDGHCSRPPNDSLTTYQRLPTSTDDPSTTFHVIVRAFQSSLDLYNDHSRTLHASTTTVGHWLQILGISLGLHFTCDLYNLSIDDVRSLKLLHYYIALDADIIENDMVTAQLIDDRRKK